jgi:ABC-type antimicrobial peptide transport system permease subunit
VSFIEYLRLCLGLGLSIIPILAFAFGLTWLIVVSPLSAPVTIALAFAATVLATPPFCWLAARIMDLTAP